MNISALLFNELVGKTVSKVEYSNEAYEDTWVRMYFTDGTDYLIKIEYYRVEEHFLIVEKGKS